MNDNYHNVQMVTGELLNQSDNISDMMWIDKLSTVNTEDIESDLISSLNITLAALKKPYTPTNSVDTFTDQGVKDTIERAIVSRRAIVNELFLQYLDNVKETSAVTHDMLQSTTDINHYVDMPIKPVIETNDYDAKQLVLDIASIKQIPGVGLDGNVIAVGDVRLTPDMVMGHSFYKSTIVPVTKLFGVVERFISLVETSPEGISQNTMTSMQVEFKLYMEDLSPTYIREELGLDPGDSFIMFKDADASCGFTINTDYDSHELPPVDLTDSYITMDNLSPHQARTIREKLSVTHADLTDVISDISDMHESINELILNSINNELNGEMTVKVIKIFSVLLYQVVSETIKINNIVRLVKNQITPYNNDT